MRTLWIVTSLAAVAGCTAATGPGDGSGPITKDEARAAGKADWHTDWCEELGWYGDGICDAFCPNPDPDCGYGGDAGDGDGGSGSDGGAGDGGGDGGSDGGAGELCTDTCRWAGDGWCDDGGEGSDFSVCEHGTDCADCGPRGESYDPCADKSCGDTCTICAPSDEDCYETAVVKQCQPDGSCAATVPECGGGSDGGSDGGAGDGGSDGGDDECGGCAEGEYCAWCWGAFQCIPDGALC